MTRPDADHPSPSPTGAVGLAASGRRYFDPTTCINCGAAHGGHVTCPVCRLRLNRQPVGDAAAHLAEADRILTSVRGQVGAFELPNEPVLQSSPSAAQGSHPTGSSPSSSPSRTGRMEPMQPIPAIGQGRDTARGMATPVVSVSHASAGTLVLGVGALCLVVAALIFAAWAWALFPWQGRAALLGALAAGFMGGARVTGQRELRSGALSLATVGAGLWVVVGGIIGHGLHGYDALTSGTGLLTIALVLAAGAVSGAAALRPVASLDRVPDALGALALLTGAYAVSILIPSTPMGLTLIAAAAVGWWSRPGTTRLLRPTTIETGGAGANLARAIITEVAGLLAGCCALVALVVYGVLAMSALLGSSLPVVETLREGWPVVSAAGLVAVGSALARPVSVRRCGALVAGALASLWWVTGLAASTTGLAYRPWTDAVTGGALVVAAAFALRVRRRGMAAAALVGAAVLPFLLAVGVAVNSIAPMVDSLSAAAAGSWLDQPRTQPWDWAALIVVACCGVALLALRVPSWRPLDAAVAVVIAVIVLILPRLPQIGPAIGLAAAGAAGLLLLTHLTGRARYGVTALGFAAVLLCLAGVDGAPRAAALAVTAGVLAGVALLLRAPLAHLVWSGCGVALLASAWTAIELAGVPTIGRALIVAGVAAVALLGARVAGRERVVVEILAGCWAAVAAVSISDDGLWLPVVLTLVGAACSGAALVASDRRQLGWVAGVLLTAASWIRLADSGVDLLEWYTVPCGVALLAWGALRLRRESAGSSATLLSPGLLLLLGPSTWAALADPLTPRAALVGAAAVVLVLAGVGLRLASPLVIGSVVLAVIALVELTPYAALVPPWVLLTVAGAVLLGVGITWEARLRDARRAGRYLRALR